MCPGPSTVACSRSDLSAPRPRAVASSGSMRQFRRVGAVVSGLGVGALDEGQGAGGGQTREAWASASRGAMENLNPLGAPKDAD